MAHDARMLEHVAESCREEALAFSCRGEQLFGILSRPLQVVPAPASAGSAVMGNRCAVLIIVGGPQYRVGSHRQFVRLARRLAAAGFPVLRFDYRGMGDSTGAMRDFEQVDEDIAAALEALQQACPDVGRVVLWGLCDAAAAALLFCHARHDGRVAGLCLLNPWVRSTASLARTHVKHYYRQRLLQADLWRKLLSGELAVFQALSGLWGNLRASRRVHATSTASTADARLQSAQPFQTRMAAGLRQFAGPVLLLLSGEDYTAREFEDYVAEDPAWQDVLASARLERHDLAEADHTFSAQDSRRQVEVLTLDWLLKSFCTEPA